jgi:cytochrome P450
METLRDRDYFSDPGIVHDPAPYFTELREESPVLREPRYGAVIVTGYDEVMDALTRPADELSNCVSVAGPIPPLPFEPKGDDIRAQVEAHRAELPWSAHLVSFDGAKHADHRILVTRLITPKRLKQNEDYLTGVADRLIDAFIARGRCEIVSEFAHAVSTLVIADLLGIPEAERQELLVLLGAPPTQIDGDPQDKVGADPLTHLHARFVRYLAERQAAPQGDAMSELANARFTDGRAPDVEVLAHLASFLFGAGQDTSARLIASAVRILAEDPALQARLRAERHKIPDFLEETLRIEAPVKVNFRLAQTQTRIGEVEVPAGAIVMNSLAAANRDPAHFPDPDAFDIDRPGLREQLAFSRGAHACPGAPLARLEARVAIERLLDRTAEIRICEAEHGPADDRRYAYEPTYMLRSLSQLHIDFTPAG